MNTAKLLDESLSKLNKLVPDINYVQLISDGGSENTSVKVRAYYQNHDLYKFKHRISKDHVRFSNNMIECWFRSLKQNYLNKLALKNYRTIVRRIKYFVTEHNNHIPYKALTGATPQEYITNGWGLKSQTTLKEYSKIAAIYRVIENKNLNCRGCPT